MSSRTAAGRKRLQQPKPQKTSSFKSPFKKTFTSDAKSPPPPPSLPSSLSNPTPDQALERQPYNLSDTSDVEDFGLLFPSTLASHNRSSETQWHPQLTDSSALRSHGSSEISSRAARVPPSSYTAPRTFNPYPSPPRSAEDIYSRGRSSDSFRGPIPTERGSPSRLSNHQDIRPEQVQFRYGSAPTSILSVPSSPATGSSSSQSMNHALHSHHYPSPPESNSDFLSPFSLSAVSAVPSTLPSLMPESSWDSASTRSINAGSSTSLAVNAPASIFSSSSGSSAESERPSSSPSKTSPGFVYPSSRSVGRPSAGGPKFKFKTKKSKGAEIDTDEDSYSAQKRNYRTPTRGTSAGMRLSMVGPSSISTPSLKSPRSFVSSNSSGSSMKSSDPGFVFPTARSRAHPNIRPRKFKKKKTSDLLDNEVDNSAQKFMGISLNRKKKNSSKTQFPAIPEFPQSSDALAKDDPTTPTPTAPDLGEVELPARSNEPSVRNPSKLGLYPLDPYESTLLDSDKGTNTLLRRLNSTDTPSFCHFGNDPPSSVLDLGSGQGHWILEAAIHWKGFGTQFTGVDIADTMKVLRPLAVKNGVSGNIKFVRSNFLKRPLPFPEQSFDLVRMANLTYAISYDKWEYVLGEVCRVLTIGGRLEFIDDHIFFPYGKPLSSPSTPLPINVGQRGNRLSSQDREDAGVHNIYGVRVDDEGDASDTATLNGNRAGPRSPSNTILPPGHVTPPASTSTPISMPNVDFQYWAEQMDASQELETLFEHMMNFRFGIHLCPSEFIQEMMSQIFGHSREVRTMHLTIAYPDTRPVAAENNFSADAKREPLPTQLDVEARPLIPGTPGGSEINHDEHNPLEHSPGLMLWPSTLLPMSQTELQAHALKHSRTLLSSKPSLFDYASETLDIDTEDDTFMEALWEYESFMSLRLNPPPPIISNTLSMSSSASSISVNTEREFRYEDRRSESDHNSIYSMSSVTSDARSAMWDYDFELRHHFAWPMEDSQPPQNTRHGSTVTMRTSEASPTERSTPIPELHEPINRYERVRPQSVVSDTHTISSYLPSFTSHEPLMAPSTAGRESIAPPDYSATEPTHVRTFHVYEAIKMDPALFTPN
ncbi:hypothetical protein J3R30DRAFT_3684216 [Lentinula aciculospora]|uniref:Methyltransferase domain-containing protein n=1 Tax=Lentinula aciculospora TaxID=153920 RepID=A0A9W9A7Y5_9AGAR|nr:hypothetical protein J3R30DRAFT_3684216 [Lentinula aciculospora]